MNYLNVYYKLIQRAKNRKLEGYVEKHHYFPISIFGKNKKIVNLTLREHFIAHKLLVKIFERKYGMDDHRTRKMCMAIHRMVYSDTYKTIFNSKDYNLAREMVIKAKRNKSRDDMKGKAYFGASKEVVESIKKKISMARIGKKINYPSNRKPLSNRTEEVFKKISNSRKKTSEKYKNMTDNEFDVWLKNQTLYTKVKNRKDRPNVNVTRALDARGIPFSMVYRLEDFSSQWLKQETNRKKFYGL